MNLPQTPVSSSISASTERLQGSYGIQYPQKPIPNLHALIIGIDAYQHGISPLSGAVSDSNLMVQFLENDLSVPPNQIVILHDQGATRSAILSQFVALRKNPNIQPLDPILIYYAGHGSEVDTPGAYKATGSKTQCIVPQDVGGQDETGNTICPIPDFTLSALLYDLAEAKGNNITVIFDCCHSASSTRGVNSSRTPSPAASHASLQTSSSLFTGSIFTSSPAPSSPATSLPSTGPPSPVGSVSSGRAITRYADPSTLPGLEVELDKKILLPSLEASPQPSITRSVLGTRKTFQRGMRSHVLLAACGHSEKAYERNTGGGGYFTSQLLDHLRRNKIDKLAYKTCMDTFPKLKTPRPQNPICEGEHTDRLFFNASAPGAHRSLIPIVHDGRAYILKAGKAQGIQPGTRFSVHLDDTIGSHNPQVGTFSVWWKKEAPWTSPIFQLDRQAKAQLDRIRSGADIHQPPTPQNSQLLAPPVLDGIQPCAGPSDVDQSSEVSFRAYARLLESKMTKYLSVYLTDAVERMLQDDSVEVIDPDQCQIQVDSQEEADLALGLNSQTGNVKFTLTKPNPETPSVSSPYLLPHTVPPNSESIKNILYAMSQWNWHVSRVHETSPFSGDLQLEFYRLGKSDTDDDDENLKPVGDNLNKQGMATIVPSSEVSYGVRVINKTDRQLYAYPFYFSTANQSIRPLFLKVHGGDQVDPQLDAKDDMTMGYGDDDHLPISFRPDNAADISEDVLDVGILRVFVTTSHADFESITQPSPFAALGWVRPGDNEFADGVHFEPKRGAGDKAKSEAMEKDLRLHVGLDPRPVDVDPTEPADLPIPGFYPDTRRFISPFAAFASPSAGPAPAPAGSPPAFAAFAPLLAGSGFASAGFGPSPAGLTPTLCFPSEMDENLSEIPPLEPEEGDSLLASDAEVRRSQQFPLWDVVDMKIVIRRGA